MTCPEALPCSDFDSTRSRECVSLRPKWLLMVRFITSSRANCELVLGLTLCKQGEVLDFFAGGSVFAKPKRLFMAHFIVLSCPYWRCFLGGRSRLASCGSRSHCSCRIAHAWETAEGAGGTSHTAVIPSLSILVGRCLGHLTEIGATFETMLSSSTSGKIGNEDFVV
jgi:hypothetical protein